jgi:hypothetical protein
MVQPVRARAFPATLSEFSRHSFHGDWNYTISPKPRAIDAAQAAMFHRAVQDELAAFESRGRPPIEAEVYGIVTGLKDTGLASGWLEVSGQYAALRISEEATGAPLMIPAGPLPQAGASSQLTSNGSEQREDANIVKVAGGDKKKDSERIRLPGSGGRGPYRDDEIPLPKQIDPLAIPGGRGGRFRLPSLSRPSRSAGQPASKPTQPTPPPSGGAGKAQVGGDDHLSKQDRAIEAGTERPFPGTPQLQKKGRRVFVEPHQ